MNYQLLGKNVRKYRIQTGMNQEELAEKVGCSSSHIGQIENNRGIPSLEMIVNISSIAVSAITTLAYSVYFLEDNCPLQDFTYAFKLLLYVERVSRVTAPYLASPITIHSPPTLP